MKTWNRRLLQAAFCTMCIYASRSFADADDDDAAAPGQQTTTLNAEQQRAVGIAVAHPIPTKAPERIQTLGLILDATTLLADAGEIAATAAVDHSASAELTRLRGLNSSGAGASQKMIEAAQADQAKAHAQTQSASARFVLHWGPLVAMPSGERQKLIDAATGSHSLLLRADLPGRHSIASVPAKAMLDVDGIQVPGRVLGVLPQSIDVQSVGLLIQIENAPSGLGPGARLPVALLTADRSGLLLPRDALLYDENGAYVYKQLNRKAGDEKTHYVAARVTLLLAYGDGWLVDGVDDDDNIVVHGAGVLWSLQGVGGHAVDDDD